ncbi:MOSC domain-containing protein [Actinoplanes campanulatus]|uniref:MOSC domain-containing protein n=1 Tax=Actinoplanes campanulatus TaxID=113559 RepID=UPI001606D6FA|nr:MOSC N-terminal beta barrel domain-containing protein [Actinoplanes campanulatus]GGN37007.1 molybdenum cofactor biosysynthesis protein [Actinoplanes campanulatus]GID40703.1 molybdenum cofactor biosysynthesis protein [Actinoplanes campanulatus]
MRIASLHTYPVKGCHRLNHDEAQVEPWGLAGDRRWMIVDAEGVGITQRDAPLLTRLTARPRPGGLHLSAPGLSDIDISEPGADATAKVRIFRNKTPIPARVADTTWVSTLLGRDARLVWQADPTTRALTDSVLFGDSVNLADGYPVLLANTASLDALNDRLVEGGDEPVPIHRFRPNIVVTGAPAWAEDDWHGRRLRIGDLTFRVAGGCARCLVTTIDQETGETGRQPLHILGRHRRFGTQLLFAVNLIPDLPGVIHVGDPVTPPGDRVLGES